MNQLLAKIKNRKQNITEAYKKILNNETFYLFPQNIQSIPYNPNTLLEDGQWYSIDKFSQQEFCLELLQEETLDSADFSSLTNDDFKKIDYLCSFEDENIYYFQKVRPSQLVIKRRLKLGRNFERDDGISIVINPFADAIYKKDMDTLYFQRLETISSIFKGIEMLYREATEEEVVEFFDNDFISLQPTLEIPKIGKASRKRIATAITALNSFNTEEKQRVIEYTINSSGLVFENNTFIINNEDDIQKLYWGITERYYVSPISQERRIANSIINIQNGNTQTE